MPSPHERRDDQPDLREVVADAMNELTQQHGRREGRPPDPVTADQVTIRCQRTMHGVRTLNSTLDGGDLSACIALIRQGEMVYPSFFLTCRSAGEERWQPVASVDGTARSGAGPFTGKLTGPRSYVTIGTLDEMPGGGRIRIELPDGNVYEDEAVNGCCIVVAPLTFPPDNGEPITIRYLDADGSQRGFESI